jgi:hypothetical protein
MAGANDQVLYGQTGVQSVADGNIRPMRMTNEGALAMQAVHGQHFEASRRGKIFMAQAIITAPVIWTTEAGTGGPLLWNGSSGIVCNILAVGIGISTVSTVAAAIGLTGGYGQTAAPTSTTAIDSMTCTLLDGSNPAASVYRVGTTGTNRFFHPLGDVMTGALTTVPANFGWYNLEGLYSVPYQAFISVAASATASTTVANICLVWEEVPV